MTLTGAFGIGLGLGIPGINLSLGGGIGIGNRRGCRSHDPSKKWIQVPNVCDHGIVEIAKFAVDEFNKKHGNNLVFQVVLEAWVVQVNEKKEYSIELVAKDCLHRSLKFHAVVVETIGIHKTRNLVSFDQIE